VLEFFGYEIRNMLKHTKNVFRVFGKNESCLPSLVDPGVVVVVLFVVVVFGVVVVVFVVVVFGVVVVVFVVLIPCVYIIIIIRFK